MMVAACTGKSGSVGPETDGGAGAGGNFGSGGMPGAGGVMPGGMMPGAGGMLPDAGGMLPDAGGMARGTGGMPIGTDGAASGAGGSIDMGAGGSRMPLDAGPAEATKVDLLFMIDNSSSMADKQSILSQVVGDLLRRLMNPACVDPITGLVLGPRRSDGTCAAGEEDFNPILDLHVGIISSSLGSHGARLSNGQDVCPDLDPSTNPHNNDNAHLLVRTLVNGVEGIALQAEGGFLSWSGTGNSETIVASFQSMVIGVGQHGCGYEAQLESIYRFLNEPNPYASIAVTGSNGSNPGETVLTDTDALLLQQRRDFLRPDSLVAVVAVTDENDCSINDSFPQGFYALLPPVSSALGQISQLQRGTSACDTNPNDPCCVSCAQALPAGCTDTACQDGGSVLARAIDAENVRCFDQKRRYGVDFLYPVERYIQGFTQAEVSDLRSGQLAKNSLFSDLGCVNGKDQSGNDCVAAPARDPRLVFFTAIVGVPWQDIAVDPNDLTKGYKTARQIAEQNIWSSIIGDPKPGGGAPPILPSDPHMIESIAPRPGLPGPDSPATADSINGHDWETSGAVPPNADLQFACTFPLPSPEVCPPATPDCDCSDNLSGMGGTVQDYKSPLCQDPTNNGYGHTQFRGKAYPGLRELRVLEGLGDQAIAASICPVNVTDSTRADFGYRPAIAALINRIRAPLRGR